ncbi:MAG: hypothetical protein V5A68_02570 [Candidatus Thermoplasmatota archaeon]
MSVFDLDGVAVAKNNTPNDIILYVGGRGPGNYSTIQNAIDNANTGDTVFVLTVNTSQ